MSCKDKVSHSLSRGGKFLTTACFGWCHGACTSSTLPSLIVFRFLPHDLDTFMNRINRVLRIKHITRHPDIVKVIMGPTIKALPFHRITNPSLNREKVGMMVNISRNPTIRKKLCILDLRCEIHTTTRGKQLQFPCSYFLL